MHATTKPIVYHIPVCPYSQRLEILLTLKAARDDVEFCEIDITRPRPSWLTGKTRGTSALPILELADGRIIKESLVILEFLDAVYARPVAQADPYRRAVERMLTAMEGPFATHGYGWVMNQDPERRDGLAAGMLEQYERLDTFLLDHAPAGPFLFDEFGWAEAVFAPLFMRFWFLEYYENFTLPAEARYARVRRWIEACVAHPAAQQVTQEQVVKLYYDYAKGAGNGALLPGRRSSSFATEPHWRTRPWPPCNKYAHTATDRELGLT
jgi:glutathione S-transferase